MFQSVFSSNCRLLGSWFPDNLAVSRHIILFARILDQMRTCAISGMWHLPPKTWHRWDSMERMTSMASVTKASPRGPALRVTSHCLRSHQLAAGDGREWQGRRVLGPYTCCSCWGLCVLGPYPAVAVRGGECQEPIPAVAVRGGEPIPAVAVGGCEC